MLHRPGVTQNLARISRTSFARLPDAWRPGHDVRPLIDAIWMLDRSSDASSLPALTVPRG